MKSNHLVASFLYTHADVLIKIVFDAEPRPDIPQIYIRIKRTDMVYVLQVKVESALANVAPNYAVSADELDLEHKGQRLKETRALDFYSITEGSEVVACADMHIPEPLVRTGYACRPPACCNYRRRKTACLWAPPLYVRCTHTSPGRAVATQVVASFCAVPSEQDLVVAQPDYTYLDQLVQATPGVPSSGMVKTIISQFGFHCQVCWRLTLTLTFNPTPHHGFHCQVCWRRRWFRCEVLRVYPTSLLVAYLDWTEVEWPHF